MLRETSYTSFTMTAVGADIESLCGKCGDVWHVVVAKQGSAIAKVQCKQCGGYHRHRPPGGKPAAKTVRKTKSGSASKAAEPPAHKATVEADQQRPVRSYSIRESFESRDRIEHPKFGLGVVEEAVPGKIVVFFPDGRRTLAQAKPASTLTRPQRTSGGKPVAG